MDLYDVRSQLSMGKNIFDLPLRVTYYARVSTDKDEQVHSLSAQIAYYTDFIKNNRKWTYVEGYIDEGISGTSMVKREAFKRMMADAALSKFDLIITKEISRFSRNTLDSISSTQKLLSCGVGVYFQSDNIITLMPDAELRLTIMSSIAQDEVRKISERVKFGFKRSIEKGVVLGSNRIWGYKKDKGKLVIDEEEAKIIRTIFDLYATKNMGIRLVVNYLTEHGYLNSNGNPFTFNTIRGIIANPKYKGYYCGNKTHKYDYKLNDVKYLDESEWVMYKDEENVPPIVSEEIWSKANRILSARSKKLSCEDRSSYTNKYPYSGKINCMVHNCRYHRTEYKYPSGNKELWQCKHYTEKGKAGCTSPVIYTSELDEVVRMAYNTIAQDRAKIIRDLVTMYSTLAGGSKVKEDMAKVKAEISNIMRMKDKLLDLSLDGRISNDEFEFRNNQFNRDIETRQMRYEQLETEERQNSDIAYSANTLREMIADELDFSEGFSNAMIDAMLDKIEVYATDEKNKINLKVYFKIFDDSMEYQINRGRNKTSVCYTPYI